MSELLNWEFWVQTQTGGFHFVMALIALVLGPYILFRRKGDQRHRWLGRIWVALMLIVNLSALTMYGIDGTPNMFHGFAVLSLLTIIPGIWMIWRFKKSRNRAHMIAHQYFMTFAYFGLFMAGFWQAATSYMRISGLTNFGQVYIFLNIFTALTAVVLFLILQRRTRS